MFHSVRRGLFIFLIPLAAAAVACVQAKPPTDTGDPSTAASPTSPTAGGGTTPTAPTTSSGPFAYDPDLKAVFASDCVLCHGGSRVDGNYRMTTYAEVMRDVVPGNASSRLVTDTSSRGSMYRYFSGSTATRQAKANMVYSWVVNNKAQQTR